MSTSLCLALGSLACAGGEEYGPTNIRTGPVLQWEDVTYNGLGDVVSLGLQSVSGSPKAVILVFPGAFANFQDIATELISSHWDTAAPAAGYLVVAVATFGPGLATLGSQIMPAVLTWLDARYPSAAQDIVFTGHSAGGEGAFHAALAAPGRVGGIIVLPGEYPGPLSLSPLAGVPVRLLVGENDTPFIAPSQATFDSLVAVGADVSMDVLPGQGHFLQFPQEDLVAWLEAR